MSEIDAPFYPGWVSSKNSFGKTQNQLKILRFFLFETPCDEISSSGVSMHKRGWPKDVWKKQDLRKYLLATAKLQDKGTYQKAIKLDDMSDKATAAGLHGLFHTNRDCNRIVYYTDSKQVDMLCILYYIRCAFAHGRFEIYNKPKESPVYVFESIKKNRASKKNSVRARIVLDEATLVDWAETIMGGELNFKQRYCGLLERIRKEICNAIVTNTTSKKKDIANVLPYENSLVNEQINELKNSGVVCYDAIQKRWAIARKDAAMDAPKNDL